MLATSGPLLVTLTSVHMWGNGDRFWERKHEESSVLCSAVVPAFSF
jgi:hypothetical protein